MNPKYIHLPFRPNVVIVTVRKNKFLIASRANWPEDFWKFPQGGIDDGEEVIEAGKREFAEEIGCDKIKVIGLSKEKNRYDWDDATIIDKEEKWRGQKQRFIIVEFLGKDNKVDLSSGEHKAYKWVTREEIITYSRDPEHMLFQHYHGKIEKVLEEFSI